MAFDSKNISAFRIALHSQKYSSSDTYLKMNLIMHTCIQRGTHLACPICSKSFLRNYLQFPNLYLLSVPWYCYVTVFCYFFTYVFWPEDVSDIFPIGGKYLVWQKSAPADTGGSLSFATNSFASFSKYSMSPHNIYHFPLIYKIVLGLCVYCPHFKKLQRKTEANRCIVKYEVQLPLKSIKHS